MIFQEANRDDQLQHLQTPSLELSAFLAVHNPSGRVVPFSFFLDHKVGGESRAAQEAFMCNVLQISWAGAFRHHWRGFAVKLEIAEKQ
jgi:hypothetical protein